MVRKSPTSAAASRSLALRDSILTALETFVEGVFRRGGDGDLSFGTPLARAPKGLPPGAAEVFTTISRRIHVRWELGDELADTLPDEFEDSRFGEFELHPKCFEPVTPQWSTADDPIWANKVVFAPDGSGDYLGIDAEGRVVFLSHDLDELHGRQLATSLTDLLERWAPLGCVGPSGAGLVPFLTKTRLSCAGAPAKRFIKLVGGQSRDWKVARKTRRKARAAEAKAVSRDAPGTFAALIAAVSDKKRDSAWAQFHDYALAMIDKCYGRSPSPALRELIRHSPGGDFGGFTPMPTDGATAPWSNAFVQAQADVRLLCGALTNTWPIGPAHLAEVDPDADEVSLRRPLLGFEGVSPSLAAFAQQLTLGQAGDNAPQTRAVSLMDKGRPLRALFEKYSVHRHVGAMERHPLPADLQSQDCANAFRALWLAYLSGAKLRLEGAKRHAAEFVRHSADVIESLLSGPDARNPGNYIHLAREVCIGRAQWPEEHDDPDNLVDQAYAKQKEQRWREMLELAGRMIDGGFRLDHAWPYRVRALQGLERHEEVLDAADRALLFCELESSDLIGAKVRALAALGDQEASEAHVWWCSPHYRAVKLKR